MNARRFITFLNRLVIDRVKRDDSYKKVFLIVDNCKVHHAKIVQEWLGKHKDKIELFFLPPYAPEYNPDEYLNSHIKRNVGKSYPQTEEQLKETTYRHLRRLGKDVDKIISFFHPKNAVYAS